jgi:hypothetical protein
VWDNEFLHQPRERLHAVYQTLKEFLSHIMRDADVKRDLLPNYMGSQATGPGVGVGVGVGVWACRFSGR